MEHEQDSPAPRPYWQWVLLALAPGIASDLMACVVELVGKSNGAQSGASLVAVVLVFMLVLMPLAMVIYLIVLSKAYARAKPDTSRVFFVIGYWIVNAFLWGGSCAIILKDGFH